MYSSKTAREGPHRCRADPCTNTVLDLKDVEHLLQTAFCMGLRHTETLHTAAGNQLLPWVEVVWAEKYYHGITLFRVFKFLLCI